MRLVFILVLLVGVGLAGFAVITANNYIARYETALEAERAKTRPQIETRQIYVAARPLSFGEWITMEDVRRVAFPVEALPEGAFADEAQLFPDGPNRPRAVLRAMETNEAVLAVKVTSPGQDAGVSARLSDGMRAFAISVDVTSGVSGFLRPNDLVDVFWTGSVEGKGGITKLIDTNVRIVAVDQSADEDRAEATVARTVTVEATPRQVAAFAQAQSTGRMSLALVGNDDTTASAVVEVDQRDLLGIERPVQQIVPEPEICTVRTRRGGEVVNVPIPCTN